MILWPRLASWVDKKPTCISIPPHEGEAQICMIVAIKFNGEIKRLKIKKQGFFGKIFCGQAGRKPAGYTPGGASKF